MPAHHSCAGILRILDIMLVFTSIRIAEPSQRFFDKDSYELAKMAVSPHTQGHHIGHQLGTALIDYARKIGAKRLYLEGNTKLEASIHLYRKLGFHEISLEGSTYDRCDIIMELKL